MSKQAKQIGLSDQERRDSIRRSLSGMRVVSGETSNIRTGKKRVKRVEYFRTAFMNAISAN